MQLPDDTTADLLRRLARIEGQVRGVQQMLRDHRECKEIVAQSGCLACHAIGENGAKGGLGPDLTHIGAKVPREAIKRSVEIGPGIMPSFRDLGEENLNEVADYLASLN